MMVFGPLLPGQTAIDDLSGLRLRKIRTVAELNAAESENIRRAMVRYLTARPSPRLAPFTFEWLLKLHGQMFGRVWTWAGVTRRRELNIGSAPHMIAIELHGLVDDLSAWHQSTMPMSEQAARLHHASVRIHPFQNGNGRWARLLANIWLRRHGAPSIEWPEATIGAVSAIRNEYLMAVREADRGEYGRLIAMHVRFTGEASGAA